MVLDIQQAAPPPSLAHLVHSFWSLENPTTGGIEATLLPDGIIDLFLVRPGNEPMLLELKGLDTEPSAVVIAPKTKMFSIGFKLPAVEYLFHISIANTLNQAQPLAAQNWPFTETDLDDFPRFCKKAARIIEANITSPIDPRKQTLFQLIYDSNGALPVNDLAAKAFWSPRQINRYFNQQFGLSLKAYCGILRFRASFQHIKQGKLFPQQEFFDQAHFIKAVKKLSGVLPKQLKENKNDRFLQFSVLPKK